MSMVHYWDKRSEHVRCFQYGVFSLVYDPAFYIMFCEIPTATVAKHLHRVESPCQECLSAKVIMAPSL